MIILQITLDELKAEITSLVGATIRESLRTDLDDKLVSPKEACKLFSPKISLTTLRKWTKDEYLKEHRVGGRVFYKYGEIMNRPTDLNKHKTQNL